MKVIFILLSIICVSASFDRIADSGRLVFEEEKSMRSSFCMYNDGKFYEARPSGCVGQEFAWGYYHYVNDTVNLIYQSLNVFDFDVIKSLDTLSIYQIVKIVDCYNQPVRFQSVWFDTTCTNLYNPGILRTEKGRAISYLASVFDEQVNDGSFQISNADTITYKWRCNRESIESINGGQLFINQKQTKRRIVLGNKRIKWVEK